MKFSLHAFNKSGVIGLNSRNLNYIQNYNERKYYPNADSKLLSKQLAIKANIPVPKLYGLISFSMELDTIRETISKHQSLVVKPEHGSGGNGILIVKEEEGKLFESSSEISWSKIRYHTTNILSGLYSLGGQVDRIILEEKVNFTDTFKNITFKGVPDIRVIVFKGIPIMAMLRLPTSKSKGKANLHQGAIGAGIDIKTGTTKGGVLGSREISIHPDTNCPIVDIVIPKWNEILEMSIKASQVFKLGYMGVDIVHDRDKGPLMLEANVRPGLAIQLANRIGLSKRLNLVKNSNVNSFTNSEKLDFAIHNF